MILYFYTKSLTIFLPFENGNENPKKTTYTLNLTVLCPVIFFTYV